ncbi:hypothetical protein, partial [Atlanticothrix silvestris]|uniref:hypothetical protein n=1 Tax=Atlanticothrix silvestris TaxID=2840444 RepID=UPI001BDCFF1D
FLILARESLILAHESLIFTHESGTTRNKSTNLKPSSPMPNAQYPIPKDTSFLSLVYVNLNWENTCLSIRGYAAIFRTATHN